MKKIISATFAVCMIAIAILVIKNVHHTPTVGDQISYTIDHVCNGVSESIQAIQNHFFNR